MKILNQLSIQTCDHGSGIVANAASQTWCRIDGAPILVGNDPAQKGIAGCPNMGPTIKPCTSTLNVEQGKSSFVKVGGKPVCLDTVVGGTDGTPPGATKYRVKFAGQIYVSTTG